MSGKYTAAVEEKRALVRVVKVESITPIKKADFLEIAHVGGWQCVVKKGEFAAGQVAMYAEIDSLLPTSQPSWAFLVERKELLKTFDDVQYARVRTLKLRGEVSQGLLTPLPEEYKDSKVGTNLTNLLGVRKLEETILNADGFDGRLNRSGPVSWWERLVRWVAGKPAPSLFRAWPSMLSKSDQERVQNIGHHYARAAEEGELFEETVKLDGQSMTVYSFPDMDEAGPINRYGVCSRNYDLSLVDIEFTWEQAFRRYIAQNMIGVSGGFYGLYRTFRYFAGQVIEGKVTPIAALKEVFGKRYFWYNRFVKTLVARSDNCVKYALDNNLLQRLADYNKANNDCISIQGELFGHGIQGNYERVDETRFAVYDVYRNGKLWVVPGEARAITQALGLEYVPVLNVAAALPKSVKEVLATAKGKGAFNPEVKREGKVYKSISRQFSFKVISNEYLLQKEKEEEAEAEKEAA